MQKTRVVDFESTDYYKNGKRTLEVVRTWAERWINNYNPELSPIWGANTDIQLCNNEQIADYISKYVTKAEPHLMSKLLSEAMADLKAGKKSIRLYSR